MKTRMVKDIMVPLVEYATVSENATLQEAVLALEKAQDKFDQARYRHRALLVLDKQKKVVSKITQIDVLTILEPKYGTMLEDGGLAHSGLTKKFMESMLDHYDLWNSSMDSICSEASNKKVSVFMKRPSEGEYIQEDDSLGKAMHQLIMGHKQSLLVTREDDIVGILRLTDIFSEIVQTIKKQSVK